MRPFAVSAGDRKDIKKKESRTLEWITLGYQGAGEARLAKYEELVWPDQFVKGSEYGIEVSPAPKVWVDGVAKINAKPDMYEYLEIDKKPQFSLVHVVFSSYLELYPKKDKTPLRIACEWSKTKPKKIN